MLSLVAFDGRRSIARCHRLSGTRTLTGTLLTRAGAPSPSVGRRGLAENAH